MTFKTESKTGSWVVITNVHAGTYNSRLYVNYGKTATLTAAKHRTEAGARKWAAKQVARKDSGE